LLQKLETQISYALNWLRNNRTVDAK